MNVKLLNLLVKLGHISPAIYDVIPKGPQAAFRTLSPAEAVELNPQPIPPGVQLQLATARVAHEVALAAVAAETAGDIRAAKRIVARAVDDFCGTPSRRRPIPWPDPWPFPSSGQTPGPRPVPVDTVRLVVALTFASIGSRMARGAAKEALGNGAERLVATALAGQPRKRVAEPALEPALSRVLGRRAAAGKSRSRREEKEKPAGLGRRRGRRETPVSTQYREEAVELEDTGVDETGGTPAAPAGSDDSDNTQYYYDPPDYYEPDDSEPVDSEPDDSEPDDSEPVTPEDDPNATEIVFTDDEGEVVTPDEKEMEVFKEWQEHGAELIQQFMQDTLGGMIGPPPDEGPQMYQGGPPEDATDKERDEFWNEKMMEWMEELRQEVPHGHVDPLEETFDVVE